MMSLLNTRDMKAESAVSARAAIEQAHQEGVTDEFILPVAIDCDRGCRHQAG
ncbi:MAG: hypothetical protein M5U34_44025 [Chloroflexi bacterium]|nr:hypothetical protein [Chloroflexota bacterium]